MTGRGAYVIVHTLETGSEFFLITPEIESNPRITGFVYNGGDTMLRTIGFLLMIAPEVRAFSLSRLREQWHHWKRKGSEGMLQSPLTMSIWPYRLLLWQLIPRVSPSPAKQPVTVGKADD